MSAPDDTRPGRLHIVNSGVLVGMLAVSLLLVMWGVILAPWLGAREDNPRLVEAELRILRGTIWDNNNAPVAETVGPEEARQRVYPEPAIGPAVGYYSFRHGTAGVEEGYDAVLRGDTTDFWTTLRRELLNEPQTGRDIRLTLDTNWQRVADTVLGEESGAVVLLTIPDGAIRAMASHPGFDPNQLDEMFDALVADARSPLLNRAAQNQYQPGMALQPLLVAAALDAGLIRLDETVLDVTRPVTVGPQQVTCVTEPPDPATWADVLAHGCPGPMLALGERLGPAGLDDLFAAFGLTRSPSLPINTEVPPVQNVADAVLASIGQENLVVTPLQMALALAVLANSGAGLPPQLVTGVVNESGTWDSVAAPMAGPQVVAAGPAGQVLAVLPGRDGAVQEFAALAVSGLAGEDIGWYLGVAPAGAPRYVVVVVLENSQEVGQAQRTGRALLDYLLSAR